MNLSRILFFLFVVSASVCISKQAKAKSNDNIQKPNILLIITDQQTADAMSCVGNKYLHTPAMDKLASSGILFKRNYVTQPLCSPWRSSFVTGAYPHEIGTISNGRPIRDGFPMLGNLVASAGYNSDYIGKWHVGASPEKAGYNFYSAGFPKDDKKAIAAVDYLVKNHEKPFFLTVSFTNPHNVCQLARADADGSDLPDGPIDPAPTDLNKLPPLPDNFDIPENEPTVIREIQKKSKSHYPTEDWDEQTWRQYLWGYYRMIEKVDAEIGKVLDALKKGGYEDNTVIIFTSDHGEGVAMHHWNQKQILYEQAVRTPLIIQWKGKTQKRIYPELVSNALDIPATILDIVGVEKPSTMRGVSLKPILEGKSHVIRDFVVSQTMFARGDHNLGATGRMLRTNNFKYIIYDNGDKREQLFNMEEDPGEMHNLVYNKEYIAQLKRHRELIWTWAKKTDDTEFPYIKPVGLKF